MPSATARPASGPATSIVSQGANSTYIKRQLLKAGVPMAGIGVLLAVAAFLNPSPLLGVGLVAIEAVLGATSLYILWPKSEMK